MGHVSKKDRKAAQPIPKQEEQQVRLSRTQKKKAAQSLQDLGERLVKLPDEKLDAMGLPGDILTAVKAAKTITKHCPLNRQIQYIGSLMRLYDPAPVREFLAVLDQKNKRIKRDG